MQSFCGYKLLNVVKSAKIDYRCASPFIKRICSYGMKRSLITVLLVFCFFLNLMHELILYRTQERFQDA